MLFLANVWHPGQPDVVTPMADPILTSCLAWVDHSKCHHNIWPMTERVLSLSALIGSASGCYSVRSSADSYAPMVK